MIPMVDLKRQYLSLKKEIDQAIGEVLMSTQFILGPQVELLEEEIAAYHQVSSAVGLANGTDALLLALRALEIGKGDEVITSPFTFFATAEVISQVGAKPVFADISPITFNINPEEIEKKITPRTRAILPVHLFGHPAEMDRIMDIAARYKLKVIEDCAQSFGASYYGKKVGTFGQFGCFSFFPSKNLGAYGDGGLVITNEPELARRIRVLRNHGSQRRYYHDTIGYNSRLDEIQAAVLRVKLKRIEEFNQARRAHAATYKRLIRRPDVILPEEREGCKHVYHQFTLRLKDRDRLAETLARQGCASAIYYPIPLHRQRVYRDEIDHEGLEASELCAAEVLSLPMFPELLPQEIERIADIINHAP